MKDLILVEPSIELKDKIIEYKNEYVKYNESNINGSCGLAQNDNFDEWLDTVLSIREEKLRDGVHASTFLSIRKSDNKIIGTIQLRHTLTDELKDHGGNIGYGIRPSERSKGYGTEQLHLVLEEAKKLKISDVMITCNKDNIASRNTAISCGGILTDENIYEGEAQQIYWINLQ